MKSVLFRKILLTYLLAIPLLLVSLELYLSSSVKDSYIKNLRSGLIIQARLIADNLPDSETGLDDFCSKYKGKTGARVTVIHNNGRVLGDSDEPSDKMDNHSDRPEIRDAGFIGVGSSIRKSDTIRKNLFYLAIAIDDHSEKKFLRLSIPLQDVETAMSTIRKRIAVASLGVTFLAMLFGLFQARRITKSIGEITDFSREAAAGDFKTRLFLKEKGELEELGKNIGNMAQELRTRLQQSEEEKQKMEAILRNMSDGLLLADVKGQIILSNHAVSKLFGIGQNIEGRPVIESLRKAELMEMIEEVVHNREGISREIELTYPAELSLMITATPYYSNTGQGEISGVVLTFHDITRLKKLEEIRKDFVANVSHEIKTPITAIKGFAETLIEGALDDRENARKFLITIKNHSERLNSLVSDLLTLSRIELGDIRIEKKHVNLAEVLDSVFTTLLDKARSKGLYLNKEISEPTADIQADRDRLIQILLNLVDNGIKFTEKGGITIKVKSAKLKIKDREAEENLTEIIVEDTGTGISGKHLSRLGERFYRVDRARSRELGGTGLGLAIVKHLVKAHGWEMKIESEEGKGTTVHIFCPAA